MRLLDVSRTGLRRADRAAFVLRSHLDDAPMLTIGERVVLRDEHGEYFAGTVADSQDLDEDVAYVLHVGGRQTPAARSARVRRLRAHGTVREMPSEAATQALLDLLGHAADATRCEDPRDRAEPAGDLEDPSVPRQRGT